MIIVEKIYPRTKDNNRALLLLDLLRDGSIYGTHGVAAMAEINFAFGKDRFKAWIFIQKLDMDDHASKF